MVQVQIINGDNVPPLPFVIVERLGCHVDCKGIGELWDPTVARVEWGLRDHAGQIYGRVLLKDGTGRNFWDCDLVTPYIKAHGAAWAERMGECVRAKMAAAEPAVAHDIANLR